MDLMQIKSELLSPKRISCTQTTEIDLALSDHYGIRDNGLAEFTCSYDDVIYLIEREHPDSTKLCLIHSMALYETLFVGSNITLAEALPRLLTYCLLELDRIMEN